MQNKIKLIENMNLIEAGYESVPLLANLSKREAVIGNRSGAIQLSQAHLRALSKNPAAPGRGGAKLTNAAFLFQLIADKGIKAVYGKNVAYLEFRMPDVNGGTKKKYPYRCIVSMDKKDIYVSFHKGIPMSRIAKLIPVVMLFLTFSQECRQIYSDCLQMTNFIDDVYRFCDAFEYEFLEMDMPDVTYNNELELTDVKMAYQTGRTFTDEFESIGIPESLEHVEVKQDPKKTPFDDPGPDETDRMKAYREGKHFVDYAWTEEQKSRVTPLSFLDTFVPIPEFYRIMNKMDVRIGKNMVENVMFGFDSPEEIRKDVVNMLLYGNPGTGKTVLAHALSAATGMPLYEVKFDKYSESDEIEGKNKIVDGKLAFTETDFLEGYEKGGLILMEEINVADQNMITGVLNNAIEYPFFIMKNGYQKIHRNPFTVIIATMNVGTEGTMWLNQAFASRFKQKYRLADPSREDFIRFLTNYGYEEKMAAYVHAAYEKTMAFLTSNRATAEYAINLSTRACLGALENISEGEDPKTALIDTIVGAIGIVDPETADNISKNVIMNLPDPK